MLIIGCGQQQEPQAGNDVLVQKIDSLEQQLANAYKPGLGEFMTAIQEHHAKLWFAGQNGNWKLADFEMKEIGESITDIKQFNQDRKEIEKIGILQPALDSVAAALSAKDKNRFITGFKLLTNSCNNCHKANDFEFNVVKIPESQTFSNQEFKP